ncbi:hypothetical protein [Methanobrevibacter sp.]|uniref:hypothetical protein n=1 Tax=Methanobrevibacter sp. TaxID=66852 RepID=UPI00388E891F
MVASIEELKRKYPEYPEDMKVFNDFIQINKTRLLLLREKARTNNDERLYEAVQHLFEDYFQYTHDKTLYDHFPLELGNGDYDPYLLSCVKEEAEKVRDHYAPMWKDSRGIPLYNGRHHSAGVIRWGDAASGCNRLATDIKRRM